MSTRRGQGAAAKRSMGRRSATPTRRVADAGKRADARGENGRSPEFVARSMADPATKESSDSGRHSGVNLLHQAMAVAAAADAYSTRGRSNISALTLQFLLGRSLELALKAFLIHKEISEARLGDMGHDLSKLLGLANEYSFELRSGTSDADREAVAALSSHYLARLLECRQAASYQLVPSRVLREIVHRSIAAAFVAIWDEDLLRYNLRRTSDRALGLCIADDACYEDFPSTTGDNPDAPAAA
jgi:hypothetical protein